MLPHNLSLPSLRTRPGARLSALLALCFWAAPALAQGRFDSWTTENGLPQNTVRAIRQTRDGYLWVATENGLARFDGVRFTVFNRLNTPGVTGNRFTWLCESRDGDLWAATIDGGLMRYHDGRFTSYTTKDGLGSNFVWRVDEDAEGTIWVYLQNGLVKWQNGRMIPTTPEPHSKLNDLLFNPKYISYGSEFLGLWRLDRAGWSRFAYGKWSSIPLPPGLTDPMKLKIEWVHEDSQRRLWFNLPDRPGESYCVSGGRLTIFRGFPRGFRAFYQDRLGRLWLNNSAGQAMLWKDGRLTPLPGLRVLFNFHVVEDREGTFWIGTYDQGVARGRELVITVYRHPGGAEANFIYPIWQDRKGDIWVSSGFHGLTRLRADSQNSRFEDFPIDGRRQTSELSSMFEDVDGSLWLGTFRYGLARFDGRQLRQLPDLSAQIKGRVDVIHRDRAGNLWLGGQTGLYRLRDGMVTRFSPQDGLACDHVRALYEDGAGVLWIGGRGGVSQFKDGKFTSLTTADGLSSDRIITFHGDEKGTLWIGTYDAGLNRLENGKLTRFTMREGLHDNSVYQILQDDYGFFWISSERGVYRVRKAELDDFAEGRISYITSTPFGVADGLAVPGCSGGLQPAGFKARDGKLWFATGDGVAVVDPTIVPFNPTPPPVMIEGCILDLQPVDFRNGVRITPEQDILEINYTGLSFIKSEKMRFRYKLQGLDRDWVEAGTRRTAYYPYLPPGSYNFTVIAANSDGVWNLEGSSLQITVLPPLWRTWWFISLVTLAAASVIAGAWKYRVAQLRRIDAAHQAFARQLIASQENERKRIAGELHDSLGQSLVIIRNWALIGAGQIEAGSPAREELDEINGAASRAINEVREIAYNLGPYHIERLGVANSIQDMVKRVAHISGVKITTDLDPLDGALSREAEMSLYRIAQEALNNVVKHSRASEARVTLKRETARIRLTISDNGKGFNPQTDVSPDNNGQTGLGLSGIAERVRLLKGELAIRSAPGQETTIEVVVNENIQKRE